MSRVWAVVLAIAGRYIQKRYSVVLLVGTNFFVLKQAFSVSVFRERGSSFCVSVVSAVETENTGGTMRELLVDALPWLEVAWDSGVG